MSTEYYIQEKIEQNDPDFFLIEPYLPEKSGAAIKALLALRHEFRYLLVGVGESSIAQQKIAWWLDEWQFLKQGKPRHPVTCELYAALEKQQTDLKEWPALSQLGLQFNNLFESSVEQFQVWLAFIRDQADFFSKLEALWFPSAHCANWSWVGSCDLIEDCLKVHAVGAQLVPLETLATLQVSRQQFQSDPTLRVQLGTFLIKHLSDQLESPLAVKSASFLYAILAKQRLNYFLKHAQWPNRPRVSALFKLWRGARKIDGLKSLEEK